MYRKIFQVIYIIFIYATMGMTLAFIYTANRQYPTLVIFLLGLGSVLAFNVVNSHFRNMNIKLFNKIDISFVGSIFFICSGMLMFYFL